MLNQFQMYMLLPMIGGFLPERILSFITGVSFSLLNFNFIPTKDFFTSTSLGNKISYPQPDEYLTEIGLESQSAVANQLSLLWVLGLIAILHLAFIPCFKLSRRLEDYPKLRKVMNFIYELTTFTIYVRLVVEAFLFLAISVISEFQEFDSAGAMQIASLCSAILIAVV